MSRASTRAGTSRPSRTWRGCCGKAAWEDLAGHYNPDQMLEEDVCPGHGYWDRDGNGLGYLEGAFVTLRHFFTTAAAAGSAAIREFNF
ncbi:DUF1877 family protein [Streptomyces sp. MS1.AVA.3]|uniref:DUF1877 family protein n=1 Tax=Streptomyces decoyicus TaxID=249567 RepID=UPI0030BED1C5